MKESAPRIVLIFTYLFPLLAINILYMLWSQPDDHIWAAITETGRIPKRNRK